MRYLSEMFTENDKDTEDSTHYKQQLHTDRTTFVDLHLALAEFVDLVGEKFGSITSSLNCKQHT